MNVLSILIRPLNYLRITHSQKIHWDITIPLFLAILATLILSILPEKVQVFKEGGLIQEVNSLIQILAGFYIASLAAVASFNGSNLDEEMLGEPVQLSVKRGGRRLTLNLTRRLFLCSLFGYLAYMSILIYFLGVSANLLVENFIVIAPASVFGISKVVFVFVYLSVFFNVMIATLIGLYYMADRIHRTEPKLEKRES